MDSVSIVTTFWEQPGLKAAIVAVIAGADLVYFRNRFRERLAANIGILLVFAGFYFRFLRQP